MMIPSENTVNVSRAMAREPHQIDYHIKYASENFELNREQVVNRNIYKA